MTAVAAGTTVGSATSVSHRPRTVRRRRARRILRAIVPALATFAVLITAWELLAASGSWPRSASSPGAIASELVNESDVVLSHLWPTVTVSVRGYLIAVVLALLLSTFTIVVPRLTDPVLKLAAITYSLPLIALAPVLIAIMGVGDTVRITIVAIAGFFPVVVGCIQGFKATSVATEELFAQLASTPGQRFRYLVLPGSLPYVFAGLKVSAAAAVLGAIIAEWTGAEAGLGVLMTLAMFAFDPPMVWLSLLTAAGLSLALYGSVALLERVVVRWDVDRSGIDVGV